MMCLNKSATGDKPVTSSSLILRQMAPSPELPVGATKWRHWAIFEQAYSGIHGSPMAKMIQHDTIPHEAWPKIRQLFHEDSFSKERNPKIVAGKARAKSRLHNYSPTS